MRLDEIAAEFRSHEFPTTRRALHTEYSDATVELADGSAGVIAALERAGGADTDGEYATFEELWTVLLCGLPADAVGRRHYSDRDPPVVGEDGPPQVSF